LIKSPFRLIYIPPEVLGADVMVRPDNRPLDEGPHTLDAVRVNVAAYPLFSRMVNAIVLCVFVRDPEVSVWLMFLVLGEDGSPARTVRGR
jgi:hypothetical protein